MSETTTKYDARCHSDGGASSPRAHRCDCNHAAGHEGLHGCACGATWPCLECPDADFEGCAGCGAMPYWVSVIPLASPSPPSSPPATGDTGAGEAADRELRAGCACEEKPCRHSERRIGDLTGPAHQCPLCEGEPKWAITRSGDVATSWACVEHLDRVMDLLQRDQEVTTLMVCNHPKSIEWWAMECAMSQEVEDDGLR